MKFKQLGEMCNNSHLLDEGEDILLESLALAYEPMLLRFKLQR